MTLCLVGACRQTSCDLSNCRFIAGLTFPRRIGCEAPSRRRPHALKDHCDKTLHMDSGPLVGVRHLQLTSVLVCGLLIFIGTEVVSIPFGFIEAFRETIGKPLSRGTLFALTIIETISECLVVIWLITKVSQAQLNEAIFAALAAFGIAILLAYPVDVLWAKQAPLKFLARILFATIVCIPIGIYLGQRISNA